jgi:thioredoxin 1
LAHKADACTSQYQKTKGIFIMAIIHVTATNFEEVKASDKTVLLDFYADWCGPCRMVAPILEDIASERDDVVIGKINVDDEGSLAHQFGVVSIPTLVVMKNGEVVHQSAGARPKAQILKLLES